MYIYMYTYKRIYRHIRKNSIIAIYTKSIFSQFVCSFIKNFPVVHFESSIGYCTAIVSYLMPL